MRPNHDAVKYYLDKHLGCPTHRDAAAAAALAAGQVNNADGPDCNGDGDDLVKCDGVQVGDAECGGRLALCVREFALWASYTNMKVAG